MSIGTSIGRAIGYTAAATVHGACVAASATGKFGNDVATGAKQGHAEHAARFASLRKQAVSQRQAPLHVTILDAQGRAVA